MTRHANAAWQVYAAFLFMRVETLVRPAYSKMWHKLSFFFCQILFWNQCPVVLLALGGRWLSRQKREGSVLKTFSKSLAMIPPQLLWTRVVVSTIYKEQGNENVTSLSALALWLWARQKMRTHKGAYCIPDLVAPGQKLVISYLWLASKWFLIFFLRFLFVFFVQQQVLSLWKRET